MGPQGYLIRLRQALKTEIKTWTPNKKFRIGIIWTYLNIKKNWDVYREYPSVVTQLSLNRI